MEKLKTKINNENKFIKRDDKRQISEIKMKKRISSVANSKLNKLGQNKNRRGTLFEQQNIKPISITFRNAPETINLIKHIKLYKEIHSKNNKDSDEQKNSMKKHLINKIIALLKSHKGMYNFFTFYQISEKAIIRLARSLHFVQKEKNEYFWYENDVSNKVYFLLKGKLSFRKYVGTHYEREIYQKEDNNVFGMNDIIYDRKRKLSCMALEECSCLNFSKDIFKIYMEESVNKIISERKKFLFKFFNEYSTLSGAKIERYISNSVENMFFRKNDVIFKEGEKNTSLFLIFDGDANLIINPKKNFYDSLPNLNLPIHKIKENAKKIEYGKIIDNCKKEMREPIDGLNIDKLDIKGYKVISTLSKGSVAGMEISTGITYFKYNLVCTSNFCAVFRIKLELFEDEHLKNLMVNLLPYFISKEKKIHKSIQNIKYVDFIINPPSCQKYKDSKEMPIIFNTEYKPSKTVSNFINTKEQMANLNNMNNTTNNFFKTLNINANLKEKNLSIKKKEQIIIPNLISSMQENESNKTYHKLMKRIDDKLDINEGGFIKLTNYNLGLLKQKNFVRLQITNNKRIDIKVKNYIKNYEEKEKSNLHSSNVKMNYQLNEESFKNRNENSVLNLKNFGFLTTPDGKRSKSGNKAKKKIWNFPYVTTYTPKYQDFINFYNNNYKIRSSKNSFSRSKLRQSMTEMMQKYEKVYSIKESTKNMKVKEIYDKLVSFKSLSSQKSKRHKHSINLKHKNFIKELIIMKKPSLQNKGINTENENNFNYNDAPQEKSVRDGKNDNKKKELIKILNDNYIDDLFYNNLNLFNHKKNNDIKNIKKQFFNAYYYNKFRNYNKNRMVLYDTGQFDMPLASDITPNEY